MANPIPNYDHNLVLPPHLGDPRNPSDLSPFPCSTIDLVDRFSTSKQRIEILKGLISFRERLHTLGLMQGFQWLDGSFLEDIESREKRDPKDLDVVTVYWGYDSIFQNALCTSLPEFKDPNLAKVNYLLDHYPFDAGFTPISTVENSRYWIQLFSHNRNSVWKGMLQVELNTPSDDQIALQNLHKVII